MVWKKVFRQLLRQKSLSLNETQSQFYCCDKKPPIALTIQEDTVSKNIKSDFKQSEVFALVNNCLIFWQILVILHL